MVITMQHIRTSPTTKKLYSIIVVETM